MILHGRLFGLLAGGLLLAFIALMDPSVLRLVWPYHLGLLLLAWATYFLAPKGSQVRLERRFDRVMSVRVPNLVRLRVTNDGDAPIRFRLRDEPPEEFEADRQEFDLRLEPGESRDLRYHVTPRDRGDFFFRDSFIRAPAPLGLVSRQSRLPTREIVRVYPNLLAVREFDLLKQRGHLRQIGIRRSRLKGVGTDFESLREYTAGDDFRKIEWKATARRGRLMVKEFEAERNQPVILVIDHGRLMMAEVGPAEKLDLVLDAALLLSNAAATAHDQVGLLVYADKVERWIAPKRGRMQVGAIIEALHALRAQPIEPDSKGAFGYLAARWKRRGLMVVFTEIEDPDAARGMLAVLGPLARRHLCLVVTVSDPHLRSQLAADIETPSGPFLRTAAALYQREREAAHRLLNQQGVRTLDAEPEELGAALVNYYLRIKATAQL
ncbi:MAG: DUF58 domain-containing protein [Armatimonadetes bacterium]|nr:DUF58 domain-containing protein [Armatimonadota bacterium]